MEQEQNRSEEPTPYKLQRAREKGMVARSMELGFLGGLLALAAFAAIAGPALLQKLMQVMRSALAAGVEHADEPEQAQAMIGQVYWAAVEPLMLLGGTVVAIVLFLEILQLRGLIFTTHPLKPDFSRLNPAKGLKRLFSARLFKETLKTLLKAVIYGAAGWWEHTRIQEADGKISFCALPKGQTGACFDATSVTASEIVFENAAHDYPQRIRYWRQGEELHAEISLKDGSKPNRWRFRRAN